TEPHIEKYLERHFTLEAFNDPNNVASTPHRHEVNDPDRAPVARELSFEDHRVVAIALAVFAYCHRWTQTPAPVLVVPDDRRKTGVRIKARRTQPVDGSAARHERTGERISNQPVIFNFGWHSLSSLDNRMYLPRACACVCIFLGGKSDANCTRTGCEDDLSTSPLSTSHLCSGRQEHSGCAVQYP